jgi:hypothetical protein
MNKRKKKPIKLSGWQERKYCQEALFTETDWQLMLKIVWYSDRLKSLLERIRDAGASEISVQQLGVEGPNDHIGLNSRMREESLPFRFYLHIPAECTWTGGFIITRKFTPPP